MSSVSIVKFDKQNVSFQEGIEKSLKLIDFRFNPGVQKIAIKPNLCYYWDYSTGETTDPKFVSALIDVLRKRISPSVEISVVESDASAMKCKYAFRMLGYEKMTEKKGVKLVNLTNDQAEKVKVKVENKTHLFSLPKTIADADVLINVPKMKYMVGCKLTCALKNIYGCNPYPQKYRYHKRLDETIVSLNKIMKPDLCIIDGIIVKGITTLKLGLIMTSTDPVAIDAAASEITGIDPHSVKYIKLASEEGIGNIDFTLKGEPTGPLKKLYPRKNMRYRAKETLFTVYNYFFARG